MCDRCPPEPRMSRRALLGASAATAAAGLFATPLARALAEEGGPVARGVAQRGRARQVVLLFMVGGPSQFETFDPKPGTATGGPTTTIPTAVPGVHVAASLPELARRMDRIALVRSMTSREGNHDRARYLMHTGYPPTPTVTHAALGALLSLEKGPGDAALPSYVAINGPGARPGYAGVAHAPFSVQVRGADGRARAGATARGPVANLAAPAGVDARRRDRRLDLLAALNADFAAGRDPQVTEAQAAMFDRARRLMDSPKNSAFDLAPEPAATHDRYGRGAFGQGCLMARRLIEEGVTCVEVMMGGWDTHQDNFSRVKELNAELDRAAAALLDDLAASGKLDETLVVWLGDFGRTPRIDSVDGRGHYPQAWSLWLAGGGVQGGRVIGATDAAGEQVKERPVTVPDLFASIAHATGLDAEKVYYSNGRPNFLVDKEGRVVRELFDA